MPTYKKIKFLKTGIMLPSEKVKTKDETDKKVIKRTVALLSSD